MTIKYTQMPLDRCANQRCDSLWLQLQFDHEQAAFTVLDKGLHLFNNDSSMVYLSRAQLAVEKRLTLDKAVFLGLDTQRPVFAIDMQLLEDTVQQQLRRQYQWHNLLAVTARIDHGDAAVLGFARAIIHWHGTHGFCGRCGSKNTLVEAGHSRLCTLESCGHQTFPRTDPAVIMMVEHTFEDGVTRCLLGRQKVWPEGMYSTLAGFVDPGESLEEAVVREVWEETGVEVADVRYLQSQPWPYPSSIMLGFIATARSCTLNINADELDDARWFSRAELDGFLEPGDEAEGFRKTGHESISRFLLDYWHYSEAES